MLTSNPSSKPINYATSPYMGQVKFIDIHQSMVMWDDKFMNSWPVIQEYWTEDVSQRKYGCQTYNAYMHERNHKFIDQQNLLLQQQNNKSTSSSSTSLITNQDGNQQANNQDQNNNNNTQSSNIGNNGADNSNIHQPITNISYNTLMPLSHMQTTDNFNNNTNNDNNPIIPSLPILQHDNSNNNSNTNATIQQNNQ